MHSKSFFVFAACAALSAAAETHTLYLVGASTLDEHVKWIKSDRPYASWGRALEPYLGNDWIIENNAYSGRSVRSTLEGGVSEVESGAAGGLWRLTTENLKAGDAVIIQFGHNDMKVDKADTYGAPDGAYRAGLATMASNVWAKGATPIFATSIRRATFDADGNLIENPIGDNVLGDYAQAMKALGAEIGVEVVDLHALTGDLLQSLGKEESEKFYMVSTGIEYSMDGEPSSDTTHPVAAGARAFAWLFYENVKTNNLAIGSMFKDGCSKNTVLPVKGYKTEKTLILDVGADTYFAEATNSISGAIGDYDRIVKKGMGTLTIAQDIQSFKGDILVQDGTLSVAHKDALGERSTNSFVTVRAGATLNWTAGVTYSAKLVYFGGDGFGTDSGALVANDVNSTSAFWQNEVFVMTGNATVRAKNDGNKTPSLFKSSDLYMNGYTNVCYFGAKGKQFNFGPKVKDAGVLDIKIGYVYFNDVALELPADASGVSKIMLDGCQANFNAVAFPSAFWPICVAATPPAFKVSQNSAWGGALEIAEGVSVSMTDNKTLTFEGGLKGGGTMTVTAGTLALGAANDDFTGTLKATGGSVKLPTQELGVRPGLVAGYSSDERPGGYAIDGDWKNTTDMPTLTNAIEVTDMVRLGDAGVEIEGRATDKQVYTYSGYIMNTNEAAQTWAFLCNMKHYVDLRIGETDETLFDNWKKYNEVRAGRATLQPGANKFVLKCYVNGSKGGRNTGLKDSNGKVYPAFGVIRNVSLDKDLVTSLAADWEQITGDDGNGNLFRYAVEDDEVVALERLGLIERPTATFRNLELSSEGNFQMDGSSAVVSNLTGTGSIVQSAGSLDGNELVMFGDWTIPAADLVAGWKLESDVPVRFADGARIVLDYASVPHAGYFDVLVCEAGISGALPAVAFTDGKERPSRVKLSADGKTLVVCANTSGFSVKLR